MKVDFTSCARVPGRAYNGANGKKIAVDWQGACWILKFPPSSMLKIDGEKINYAKILASPPDDLKDAVGRILPRIDLERICAFVDDVPYLTDLQRAFYKRYLKARRQKLFGGKD